ncbi:potassium channel subfamily K member 17 [Tachyglossus aculeatus]|uniref:potassium channel subfamily K member 17 n=1 Tax=Tachyglossus aculeatus TaxID=9261 RepID=UPI0018F331D4|nr:potassium channel subfamily K member 17 [Tachyglossus aculeatus]
MPLPSFGSRCSPAPVPPAHNPRRWTASIGRAAPYCTMFRRRGRGCPVTGTTTMLLLLGYLGYLALGTAVFWALEGGAQRQAGQSLQLDRWALLRNHTCLDPAALDKLIKGIVRAYKSGIILQGNKTNMGRWELVGSFFFSVSTITTIGYGNLSPNMANTRLFCIFFAFLGIPLHLILLNHLGWLMLAGVQQSAQGLNRHWRLGQDPRLTKRLAQSCALLSGFLFFFLLPPLLFCHMEGWSYEEGFYFSFITLSTIGFGDYIVGMNPEREYPIWYKNVVSLWILFGMAWLSLVINLCIHRLAGSGASCLTCGGRRGPRRGKMGLTEPPGSSVSHRVSQTPEAEASREEKC